MSKPASPELLNIINKVIITMPEEELQSIIYSNTIYRSDITLLEMVRRHPLQAVAAAAAVLFVVIGVLSWGVVAREKLNRKISLELKKHQKLYGLVNDYFFEYDLKKELLTVSGKREGEKHENNVVYRLSPERMADAPENGKYKEMLRQIMHSGRDGVEEIQLLIISLGAVLVRPQNDYDSLYIRADKALYREKKEGRNMYFIA